MYGVLKYLGVQDTVFKLVLNVVLKGLVKMTPKLESLLIYAKSGMTKTTQLYHLVKWLHKQDPTKQFRIVTAELGNNIAPFEDSGMVDEKIVDIFDVSGRVKAFADIHRIGRGYWPRRAKATGEIYFESDDACMTKPEKWAKIGGYIFEGFTSLGNLWLNHSSDQVQYEGNNIREVRAMGYKPSFSFMEDNLTITGSQPAHYGIVQKEVHKFYQHLSSLVRENCGGLLAFTALEGKGDESWDTLSNLDKQQMNSIYPIYGPRLVGSAYTAYMPSWFRHTLHLDRESIADSTGKIHEKVVAWFVNHSNEKSRINYLCKPRILPEMYPKLMEKYPGGFVQIGFNRGIDKYFETLEELRREFRGNKVEEEMKAAGL